MNEQVIAFATSSALVLPDTPESTIQASIVWMPAGRHDISAGTIDGDSFVGSVVCDEQAARVISNSFENIQSSGQRVWIDFDHEDGEAAAWVKSFSWDPKSGIIAHLDWTPKGEQSLRGKAYYSFSPAFLGDRKSGRVHGLIRGHAAGGLVNAPAFGAAMPALIAARFSANTNTSKSASGGNPEQPNMKDVLVKLLAALSIPHAADATEEQLVALFAKHNTESAASHSKEVNALKSELATVQAANKAVSEAAAVQAKKSQEDTASVLKELTEVKAVQAAAASLSSASAIVSSNDLVDVLAAYAAKDPAQLPANEKFSFARAELARERAAIWAKHLAPFVKRESLYDLVCLAESRSGDVRRVAAKAATGPVAIFAANSLGTLSGSLIMQNSMSLLKAELPPLSMFTSDFSNASAKLNQTIISRVRSIPAVQSYSTSAGYVKTDVTDTDVPVTINAHRYVQFDYNANELASTSRDLFGEQAEGSMYALGKDLVDSILALVTVGNFSTSGGATVVAQSAFNRAAVIAQRVILKKRHVPLVGAYGLTNEDYFGQLSQDASIVSLAAFQRPEIITDYVLPNVSGFKIVGYADLPTTGNLAAFFATKDALVMATRLPYDYVDAQAGANYGTVSQVTDPDTGLSIMLTQYVSHDAGASRYRVALMSGVAVGDIKRCQIVTSA